MCLVQASDALSCGACGNACDLGEMCSGGKCESWFTVTNVCPGTGRVNCATDGVWCKNILNDPKNCGGCGVECSDAGWCEGGVCTVAPSEEEGQDDD